MVDLIQNKISIYSGINDQPIQATAQEGCNGAWMVKAINDLIDEVNLIKSQPSGNGSSFQISASGTAAEEFSYIDVISATDYDGTILSVYISNSDSFYDFYIDINNEWRVLSATSEPDIFTCDEPNFVAGDSIDLLILLDEEEVLAGYSQDVEIIIYGSFIGAPPAQQNQP